MIVIYGIAKNEQVFAQKFMTSCQGADKIIIGCDEGDTTANILSEYGAEIVTLKGEFRFDSARNQVLNKIPNQAKVCISLDLDESLEPGWKKKLLKDWLPRTTRLRYKLRWSDTNTFEYDRIHARHNYVWKHPTHEAVYHIDPSREVVSSSTLTVIHSPDARKDRSKNLKLLQLGVIEDPNDQRNLWYYGRELYYLKRFDKAIIEFDRYLKIRSEKSDQYEVAWACAFIGRCYSNLNDFSKSEIYHLAAIQILPIREFHYEIARLYSSIDKYHKSVMHFKLGVKCYDGNQSRFIENNLCYTEKYYHDMMAALRKVGDNNGADKLEARLMRGGVI